MALHGTVRISSLVGLVWFAIVTASPSYAGRYDYLKKFDPIDPPPHETLNPNVRDLQESYIEVDMQPFLSDFAADGQIDIYLGYGKDSHTASSLNDVFDGLKAMANYEGIPTANWSLDTNSQRITFDDTAHHLKYAIQYGTERNAFVNAFNHYEIVMYHGHSRYGRGPAFETYSNYYRLGNVFETIEIDTRNPYFQDEPLMKTTEYPPMDIQLDGRNYQYQYVGQKDHSSYLADDAYTKVIPGGPKDFDNTAVREGRQIFWLSSCSNIHYFKVPIRARFPDVNTKLVFGSNNDTWIMNSDTIVFIMSLVRQLPLSSGYVEAMNDVGNCGSDCYVVY